MVFPGKAYDEIEIGEQFADALTVTETHLVMAAGMFGDFNPLHVNQQYSESTRFGGRILHGPFTAANEFLFFSLFYCFSFYFI